MSNVNTQATVNTNTVEATPVAQAAAPAAQTPTVTAANDAAKKEEKAMSKFNLENIRNAGRTFANHTAKATSTTGKAIVSGVAQGHATGVKYVAQVIDHINGNKYLAKGDTVEGVLAQTKEVTKTMLRFTIKVVAVPAAYAAGLVIGFGKGIFNVFKDAYASPKAEKTTDAQIEEVNANATEVVLEETTNQA